MRSVKRNDTFVASTWWWHFSCAFMAQDARTRSRSNSSYTAGATFNLQMPLPPVKNLPPHLQALQTGANPGRASLGRSQDIARPADPLPKPPPRVGLAPVAGRQPPPSVTSSGPPLPPPRAERPSAPGIASDAQQTKSLPVPPVRARSNSSAELYDIFAWWTFKRRFYS